MKSSLNKWSTIAYNLIEKQMLTDLTDTYQERTEVEEWCGDDDEVVKLWKCSLSDYVKRSGLKDDGVLDMFVRQQKKKDLNMDQEREQEEKWKEKHPTNTCELEINSWQWMETDWMKKEPAVLLMAAQYQAIFTRHT